MKTSPQYMRDAGSVPPGIPKKKSLYLHMASEERAAESVYRLMPRLTKEEFCQKMSNLGDHPDGRIAQAYASWLLLRRMPPSDEKAKHWEEMIHYCCHMRQDHGLLSTVVGFVASAKECIVGL